MAKCLVQRSFARSVHGEAILLWSEALRAAAIAGNEDKGFDGDLCSEERLGGDDGTDGVGLKMEVEGCVGAGWP